MSKPIAETFPAVSWTCSRCNRLNYTMHQTTDSHEREIAFRALHDLDADSVLPESWKEFNEQSNVTCMPSVLTCVNCKLEHVPHFLQGYS